MCGLLHAWRDWWRQNADILDLGWAAGYPEAVPHLVLLAFLQRVVNGGGTDQLVRYLDTLAQTEGWLIVFDQRPGKTWEERLWDREVERDGKRMHLLGG